MALALLTTGAFGASQSSDVSDIANQLIGHPKDRFPLKIYADSTGSRDFDSVIREAVGQWNQVFESQFGIPAFAWSNNKQKAQVLIQFSSASSVHRAMGETDLDADKDGVIRLPVKITLVWPKSRGKTGARQVLFDVAAHELGHALGLPHINKPASIMCCDAKAIDFENPTARDAYVAARRHPDLDEVAPDLAARYRKFWGQQNKQLPR
ncbi:MAG TPA: matrixin family metalloprotease [Candidatus Binataceae bacterium]|nr:matrixin family metalloprotease [Candidatus Binataceae bacterium]